MFEFNDLAHVIFEHTGSVKNIAQVFTLDEKVVKSVIIEQNLLSHFQLSDPSAIEIELNLSQYERRKNKIKIFSFYSCDYE